MHLYCNWVANCVAVLPKTKNREEGTGRASDIVKAKAESTGKNPKATGGLVSILSHHLSSYA